MFATVPFRSSTDILVTHQINTSQPTLDPDERLHPKEIPRSGDQDIKNVSRILARIRCVTTHISRSSRKPTTRNIIHKSRETDGNEFICKANVNSDLSISSKSLPLIPLTPQHFSPIISTPVRRPTLGPGSLPCAVVPFRHTDNTEKVTKEMSYEQRPRDTVFCTK